MRSGGWGRGCGRGGLYVVVVQAVLVGALAHAQHQADLCVGVCLVGAL